MPDTKIAIAAFTYINRSECVGNMSLEEILEVVLGAAPSQEQIAAADLWINDYRANNAPAPPPAVAAPTKERYDARFYPHGSTHVHFTVDTQFKLGDDSTVTALCGKTYTRWIWAEHIDKPICPACAKADAAFTQKQIDAVTWALDGQPFNNAQDGLARLARAFNFRIERFVWCNNCAAFRTAGHQHR